MPEPQTLLEGKYEILSKIREGGMGTIYLVRHRLLDKIRVIKVMRAHVSADPDLRRRFTDEAKMATRLNHPNLCVIHDFAIGEDATGYLVMEYIEGVNIAELLAIQGPPGLPLALEVAHQTLLALGYLHRKNVVHRDVAPDNLMLSKNEEGRPLVKVVDLGIAKEADRPTEMTATGVFLGKLRYASPEQAGSLSPGERLDGRSDLYSLGIVLYELLTGKRPFSGDSPAELLRAQLFNPPLSFSESDPEGRVPPELRAVILRALEKKRDDRYASAEEFDQKIVALQQRLDPSEIERARTLLAEIPAVLRATREPVTPSAQDRLNLQFAAHTTPPPSGPSLTVAPTVSSAHAIEVPPSRLGRHPSQEPTLRSRTPVKGRGPRLLLFAAAAAAAAVLALYLIPRRAPNGRSETRAATLRASPVRVADSAVAAEPTEAVPTPEPTPEPTAEPPQPTRPPKPTRVAATEPRREEALRSRPTARVPTVPRPAEVRVAEAAPARPTPPLAEPARPAALPTAAPATVPVPAAVPSVPPAASETDRIRETIRGYEKAQSTLDAALYARIFPSVDRDRIGRAFESLASQTVQFEVRKIQIDPSGTQARVDGYEKRIAVPRAGTEQRVNADRVLYLEKRPEGWVIVRLS